MIIARIVLCNQQVITQYLDGSREEAIEMHSKGIAVARRNNVPLVIGSVLIPAESIAYIEFIDDGGGIPMEYRHTGTEEGAR